MAFPENLQFLRTQKDITQEQLAEQLNVSRQSVSKWESGTSFPEMDTLLRICDLYTVNLDTLLRGSVEESFVQDISHYDAFMNRFSLCVTCAVGAIMASLAALCVMDGFGVNEMLSTAFFMLVVTVSVVALIAIGIEDDHFRKKHPIIQDFYTEEEKDAFHRRFIWYMSGGVGAIMFGVVFLLLSLSFLPETEPNESLVGGIFLLILAGAVMSFTYGGLQEEKYKVWKYNRDNDPTPEAKKQLDLRRTVCICILLSAFAIHAALGLYTTRWDNFTWVIVLGGALCLMAHIALNPYKGSD